MRRDFIAYLVLLIVGLGAAYYTSLPRDEKASEKTEWVRVDPKAIQKIVVDTEKTRMEIIRRGDGFWAQGEGKEKVDRSAAENQAPFRLSKKLDKTLEGFNPLYVLRDLGDAKDFKLEDFGLKDAQTQFIIETSGGPVIDLVVGKKSYGTRNSFVIDQKTNRLLLIGGGDIEDLEKAQSRLMQKDLMDIDWSIVTSAQVSSGGLSKKLDHTQRDGAGELVWSDASSDGKKSPAKPAYKSLMTQLDKTGIKDFANEKVAAELEALKPFGQIDFFKGSSTALILKFYKNESNFYVHNSNFDAYVQINSTRGEGLEKDFPEILK